MKTIREIVEDCAEDYYPYHEFSGAYEDNNKEALDRALKELEELLLECKPEKKTKKDVPDPYEVGIHATIPVAQASGYNQAIDDYEKNIKEVLK